MNVPSGRPPSPSYLRLHRSGELAERARELGRLMDGCCLCPRSCGAQRTAGERGTCGAATDVEVASCHPHFGEERPLVGRGGSGTIFLAHCSLRCVFCINWDVSQGGAGEAVTSGRLAEMMLELQRRGCHNINLVTPTHYAPQIVEALDRAAGQGLRLPLVYNTSGYERVEILRLLDGIVDIYLPDFKYWEPAAADGLSTGADDYPQRAREAVLEMHRQVGAAGPAADGLMYRGLMIRHLVMPGGLSGTRRVIDWIADELPKDSYLNLMSQYRPAFRAAKEPALARRLTRAEYEQAVEWALARGLTNLDVQGWPP